MGDRNALELYMADYHDYALKAEALGENTAVQYRNALFKFLLDYESSSVTVPPFRAENLVHSKPDEPLAAFSVGRLQQKIDEMESKSSALVVIKALHVLAKFTENVATGWERQSGISFPEFHLDDDRMLQFRNNLQCLDTKLQSLG